MKKTAKLLFLGTGSSFGTPVVGCDCAVCLSKEPLNSRLRQSVLITVENKKYLIDSGPDFRQQALKYSIKDLDGMLLTHTHYDHIAGIDELRIFFFKMKQYFPCLLSKSSYNELKKRYGYLFEKPDALKSSTAKFDFKVLEKDRGVVEFKGLKVKYLSYYQGGMEVSGYRFGNLAYISDVVEYPETIYEDLKGVKILIVGALRYEASRSHFSIEQAIEFSKKIGAKSTWLVHMGHELDHKKTCAKLPENIQLAYDGLEILFTADMADGSKKKR